jgi:hypothetical protein
VEGNIEIFEMNLPPTLSLPLSPGQTSMEELDLYVTSTDTPWHVAVKADNADGKMRESSNGAYVQGGSALANQVHILCGSRDIPLTGSDQDLILENTATGTHMLYKIKVTQYMDNADDHVYPNKYRIVVTLKGGFQH